MALRLALQTPEQVAGIAIAGASLPIPKDSSCPEQGSVPLLVVDGEKDPFNPIDGGRVTLFGFGYRGRALSAFDTAHTFAKRLGVTSASRDSPRPAEKRRPHLSRWIAVAWRSFPVVCLLQDRGRWHVVPQPVFRYPRILGHTTTAVDMPKLMIEMFTSVANDCVYATFPGPIHRQERRNSARRTFIGGSYLSQVRGCPC